MSSFIVNPINTISGSFQVSGNKSISHRAIILGSIACGITKINGFLQAEDTLAMLKSFQNMGVRIKRNGSCITIHGVGLYGLKKPAKALYVGNSGTSMRLLAGLLAAQSFDSELTGDVSLRRRPMNRIIEPLGKMGASISSNKGCAPLKIIGRQNLNSIEYILQVPSAQVKSCLLLAGLYIKGTTTIIEPVPVRNHTEIMLKSFAGNLITANNKITIKGGSELFATDIKIAGDISSATFFIVAATISSKADIMLTEVNINPTSSGVITILKFMGADIEFFNKRFISGEPIADIRVRSAKLKGINISKDLVSFAIDEFPAIFIAASCAYGTTTLTGAKELRVKESDRIKTMADGLDILGINNQVLPDGIIIEGGVFKKPSTIIKSRSDHRIAMAFTIASLRCEHVIEIDEVDNIKTSFPDFIKFARYLGFSIQEIL